MPRLVSVDDEFNLPDSVNVRDTNLPANLQSAALSATYVTFRNFDGTPVTGKHVEITLTADGTDIDNIRVVTP